VPEINKAVRTAVNVNCILVRVVGGVELAGAENFRKTYSTPGLNTVRLWVSPLRRGSSEGLPAALTRHRDFNVLPIFGCILVESPQRLSVDVQHVVDHRR